MVYLNRIYTRTGDDGTTGLGNGARVSKTHPRIRAYGGVDELNAVLGVALAAGLPGEIADWLSEVQNDLFDVGADLCVPEANVIDMESDTPAALPLRVSAGQIAKLERWIDAANERLQPLRSFILPGGTPAAAHLHHARTVCRRVEIGVLELTASEPLNPQVATYLNRLSDLLFVLARLCNDEGRGDVLWQPGRGRDGGAR
jgi:cob(I)alamin adenosyltransferase